MLDGALRIRAGKMDIAGGFECGGQTVGFEMIPLLSPRLKLGYSESQSSRYTYDEVSPRILSEEKGNLRNTVNGDGSMAKSLLTADDGV